MRLLEPPPLGLRGGDYGGFGGGGFVAPRSLIGALPLGGVAPVGVRGAGRLLLLLPLLSHRRLVWGEESLGSQEGVSCLFLLLCF